MPVVERKREGDRDCECVCGEGEVEIEAMYVDKSCVCLCMCLRACVWRRVLLFIRVCSADIKKKLSLDSRPESDSDSVLGSVSDFNPDFGFAL